MDSNTININQIVNEIERLDYNDKINILSRIVNLLKREEKVHLQERATTQVTPSLIQLKGLGKNVWQKNDVASYISTERESWD
jgi:leucyl aminopeptidase (aminopeptidase T)